MASKKKKKSRGKGKRAAKKFGGKEEGLQQGTLDKQMERLNIDEDSQTNADEEALLEEAIKRAAAEKEALDAETAESEGEEDQIVISLITIHSNGCHHEYRCVEIEDEIITFTETFLAEFVRAGLHINFGENLRIATKVVVEKYPDVWFDCSKLKQVVSLFLFNGTQKVLEGEFSRARFLASIACYFNQFASFFGENGADKLLSAKLMELFKSDEHTLVKYLRKSIPCSCLDEKYKEVKSITKTGICSNSQCPLPDRFRVERSNMFSCARCGNANYCSRECQKADWRRHKSSCAEHVALMSMWESRKQEP